MAMNTHIKEGSILLYYPEIREMTTWRGYRSPVVVTGYELMIKALYVYSRRARTNGTSVPSILEPYLHALKVKTSRYGHESYMTAIGCSTKTIYNEHIPADGDISKSFRNVFQNIKEKADFTPDFFENEFVEKFLNEKINNRDKKFSLFTPIEQLKGFYPVKEIHALEDGEIWSESRYNRGRYASR